MLDPASWMREKYGIKRRTPKLLTQPPTSVSHAVMASAIAGCAKGVPLLPIS